MDARFRELVALEPPLALELASAVPAGPGPALNRSRRRARHLGCRGHINKTARLRLVAQDLMVLALSESARPDSTVSETVALSLDLDARVPGAASRLIPRQPALPDGGVQALTQAVVPVRVSRLGSPQEDRDCIPFADRIGWKIVIAPGRQLVCHSANYPRRGGGQTGISGHRLRRSVGFAGEMAVTDRPTALAWWEVPWISGTVAGVRHVRAPDAVSAEHDLEQHPSDYGLPFESVIVGRARLLTIRIRDRRR
jgi:hypothetical protein